MGDATGERVVTSFDEYLRTYFPHDYETAQFESLDAAERGRLAARGAVFGEEAAKLLLDELTTGKNITDRMTNPGRRIVVSRFS